MTEKEIDEYLELVYSKISEAYNKLDVLLANNSDIKDAVRYPICAVIRYLLLYQEKRDVARGKISLDYDRKKITEEDFANAEAEILRELG